MQVKKNPQYNQHGLSFRGGGSKFFSGGQAYTPLQDLLMVVFHISTIKK